MLLTCSQHDSSVGEEEHPIKPNYLPEKNKFSQASAASFLKHEN